jgi:hypothetical protein
MHDGLLSLCSDSHYAAVTSSDVGDSTSSADRDLGLTQSSSISSNNEICYHNFMWNNNSDENPFDSSGGRDGGDDSVISNSEDLDVRMDLTDDLLHMVNCIFNRSMHHSLLSSDLILYFPFSTQVFSFLDHINLCRAAMVCRQWQAASAHEDFWRCLDFENRNISVEQCEFYYFPYAKFFTLSSSCI